MPWYLKNGDGSLIANTSLKTKGGCHIWNRLDSYVKPDGSRDLETFTIDLWAVQTLHFVRKRKMLAHCLPAGDGIFLSDRVRSIIDRLEPSIHDPIKIRVFTHDGEPYPWAFWYYQHLKIPRVDAIDIERSRVKLKSRLDPAGGIFESPVIWSGSEPDTFLDARNIKGHHFFRERRTSFNWIFFSDKLASELKVEGLMRDFRLEYVGLTHAGGGEQ